MPAHAKFDEAAPKILEFLRACVPRDIAAELGGVSRATFYSWLKDGREAKSGKKKDFVKDVEEAEASAEAGLVMTITKKAMDGDVKAAMWLLERSRSERWARRPVAAPRAASPASGDPRSGSDGDDEDDWDLHDNVVPIGAG